jgi:hypothetical protein
MTLVRRPHLSRDKPDRILLIPWKCALWEVAFCRVSSRGLSRFVAPGGIFGGKAGGTVPTTTTNGRTVAKTSVRVDHQTPVVIEELIETRDFAGAPDGALWLESRFLVLESCRAGCRALLRRLSRLS